MTIASVDAGNGGVNSVVLNGKSQNVLYEPSVRAAATGSTLGLGELEVDFSWVKWNDKIYATGDDVAKFVTKSVERHMGLNRYGDEFHQFLVANALARSGVKSGEIDLIVFAPPGIYQSARQDIIDRFMQHDGQTNIMLKGDKKYRNWSYKSVSVLPEGVGAAFAYATDDKGSFVETDALEGDVLVVDLGVKTLDILHLQDGKFNLEQLNHATWTDGGIDSHIRQNILSKVREYSDDFSVITVDHIDRAIRCESFEVQSGRSTANIKRLYDSNRESYAMWIANNVIDTHFDGLNGYRSVIFTGGGANMVIDFMSEWYPKDKIIDQKKYSNVKKYHPSELNAVGGMRFMLFRRGNG